MTWTRKDLKAKAKEVLKKTYFTALVISIVMALVSGVSSGGSGGSSSNTYNNNSYYNEYVYDNAYTSSIANSYSNPITDGLSTIITYGIFSIVAIIMLVFGLLMLLFRILVGYALQVGGTKYFIETGEGRESSLQSLAFGFRNSYKNITITMLKTGFYNWLWYLALIIPGIIKSYAWRFVPYILADNPNINSDEARKLSEQMTMGHKMDMFVLDLSFIGWDILGSLLFGIGRVLVYPYKNATYAQLYLNLRSGGAPVDTTNNYILN